ncbi:hypothetical protein [Kitasatospora sp. NPDC001683]
MISPQERFFTDTSVCIGCKACEVACKEWNAVPEHGLELIGMSYDNTRGLGGDSWRHVAFVEESRAPGARLYGADPRDGVDGAGAFFLLLDEPEVYGLPPDPVVTIRDLPAMWRRATVAAVTVAAGVAACCLRRAR